MKLKVWSIALLSGSAMVFPGTGHAQESPSAPAADLAALQAQVEALQAQVNALKAQVEQSTPSWRGAPQQADKKSGFTFKPKGFAQFDSGSVENPNEALVTQNLGFNTRARRLVLGAEGALPGGFGYKVEFNFAGGNVDYEDVVLTYSPKDSPLQLTLGNFYPLSGLETMTSSRLTSFLERAQAVDAFGFSRRLGFAAGVADKENDRYTFTAGIFSAPISNAFGNDSWQASVRGTFSPELGGARLHLGASYQHREGQSGAQNVRYRARPFAQLTDVRFVDTGAIAARGDDILGLELAGIFGPFHFASEAQRVWVDSYRQGTVFTAPDSVGGGLFYAGDPNFSSSYLEAGYYLTGETRGYKAGRWDRTKVLKPIGEGGIGAVQVNVRLDYLDLADRLTGGDFGAPNFVNGGSQTGYQLSAIWNPIDYVRFMLQYSHASIEGGPLAVSVRPACPEPPNRRGYSVDSVAMRAQVEF